MKRQPIPPVTGPIVARSGSGSSGSEEEDFSTKIVLPAGRSKAGFGYQRLSSDDESDKDIVRNSPVIEGSGTFTFGAESEHVHAEIEFQVFEANEGKNTLVEEESILVRESLARFDAQYAAEMGFDHSGPSFVPTVEERQRVVRQQSDKEAQEDCCDEGGYDRRPLGEDRVEEIRTVMSNISLANVPVWVMQLGQLQGPTERH